MFGYNQFIMGANNPSGTIISPLEHYPEREARLVFRKIADGSPNDLDSFWQMILSSMASPSSPVIEWQRDSTTPHFAYGTYSAGADRIGRIWIEIAPTDDFKRVDLHLRMVEQRDNL